MRIEIVIFGITALLIFNLYTEGKYVNLLFKWKKYYQMIGIALGGLVIYYLVKKNPLSASSMLTTTNEYLKYMPIDKNTSSILNPILDFTAKYNEGNGGTTRVLPMNNMQSYNERKIMTSGLSPHIHQGGAAVGGAAAGGAAVGGAAVGGAANGVQKVKRSVSETKKKFVASRQAWKCGDCQEQLNAWFEVDHKIRLEHGGSNHIDNLVALCRECHGKKTTIENL